MQSLILHSILHICWIDQSFLVPQPFHTDLFIISRELLIDQGMLRCSGGGSSLRFYKVTQQVIGLEDGAAEVDRIIEFWLASTTTSIIFDVNKQNSFFLCI